MILQEHMKETPAIKSHMNKLSNELYKIQIISILIQNVWPDPAADHL